MGLVHTGVYITKDMQMYSVSLVAEDSGSVGVLSDVLDDV